MNKAPIKYEAIQTDYTLCKDIEDLYPYELKLPAPPKPEDIINYGLPPEQQLFKRVEVPKIIKDLNYVSRDEAFKRVEQSPELTAFIEKMWYKFTFGEWQYINGKALHISPTYWFYLNFWKLDTGFPQFRYDLKHFCTDLWEFAWWDYMVQPHQFCYGEIQGSKRRGGKCFGLNTPIRMYDGSIKMVQDITEGELVMGNDSTPRKAYGITKGKERMYKISPNKGDSWTCNESHILSLYYNNQVKNRKRNWQPKSVVNITVKDYLQLENHEKEHLCLYRNGWGDNYQANNHYIPPYMLGLYLGDGGKKTGAITSIDHEIKEYVYDFAKSINLCVTKRNISYFIDRNTKKTSSCPLTITIDSAQKKFDSIRDMNNYFGWSKQSVRHKKVNFIEKYSPVYEYENCENPYRKELKRLGVLPDKHIPKSYLIDSRDNRLQLLAGLIDTDGYLNYDNNKSPKSYEITQKNKRLSDDIVELARSLGFYVSIREKTATLKRQGKQDYKCVVYRICIYGELHNIPCKIKRKKAINVNRRVNSLNTGFTIEDIGQGDYYGFAVDGNHLFLLSDGTVVHNTYKAMCKGYKRLIGTRYANGSIQSKTEADAMTAFTEKMVMPWTNLPFFFKPFHANSSFPKAEGLQFMPKSKKGAAEGTDSINPDDFLFSKFKSYASNETAVDGTKQYIHISDEDGKCLEADVWERHTILKPCLTDNGQIIGKEICTTTVEDMEKGGGMRFWYKWDKSDRNPNRENRMVDENGETVSGLWPWFCPASCNEVQDRFGCAIIDEPTLEQKAWLRDVKKDRRWNKGGKARIKEQVERQKTQADRFKEMRKYPEKVRDMFLSASGRCLFDQAILDARIKHFAGKYDGTPEHQLMTFGTFAWKGGVYGGEVEFLATSQENARWWISYMPLPEHCNKWRVEPMTGKKAPANWHKFCAGADPFKFDTDDVINKNKMSDGAMLIYAEYDITVDTPNKNPMDYVTDDFCAEYLFREDGMTVDDLCEDYLKACIFYGCKIFPEGNNPEVIKYFKNNGFEHYLQWDMQFKKDDMGVYMREKGGGGHNTDSSTIQSMFKVVQRYVKEKGMRCKFYRTLTDFRFVQPDKMNPYDLFVAAATCLRVVQEFNPIRLKEDDSPEDISDLIGAFSPKLPYGESSSDENNYGSDY